MVSRHWGCSPQNTIDLISGCERGNQGYWAKLELGTRFLDIIPRAVKGAIFICLVIEVMKVSVLSLEWSVVAREGLHKKHAVPGMNKLMTLASLLCGHPMPSMILCFTNSITKPGNVNEIIFLMTTYNFLKSHAFFFQRHIFNLKIFQVNFPWQEKNAYSHVYISEDCNFLTPGFLWVYVNINIIIVITY